MLHAPFERSIPEDPDTTETTYLVRVHEGAWSVLGPERIALVTAPSQEQAFTLARHLAALHPPSRVLVYDGDGHLRVRCRFPEVLEEAKAGIAQAR